MNLLDATPSAVGTPADEINWKVLLSEYQWLRDLEGVEQSPVHHQEGDVLTHVRMVCEQLVTRPAWQQLPPETREELFAATLLHDIAKPECSRQTDDGGISSRGHARRGAIRARRILWEQGVDPARRERICGIVQSHMLPFHLLDRDSPLRDAARAAEVANWEFTTLHAEADARGRICDDIPQILERIDLARDFVTESGFYNQPLSFANDHTRVLFFRGERELPHEPAWFDPTCTVTVMSGLPGAGKDTWIERHADAQPVVSLDDWREKLSVSPAANQGRVVQAAREAAREHLRAGRDFVWNATNISRPVRSQCLKLLAEYGARIEIVHVEASPEQLLQQNQHRNAAVPRDVMDRLIDRWEPPTRIEAHRVTYVNA
ncbi:MAG: ATP-binding protein [Planctomycetota bacterium]